jgi:hypothetical protein
VFRQEKLQAGIRVERNIGVGSGKGGGSVGLASVSTFFGTGFAIDFDASTLKPELTTIAKIMMGPSFLKKDIMHHSMVTQYL